MKVLFIANGIVGDNPGLSGGEIRFIEIAKSWQADGHEIHLLSSKGGKNLCNKMGLNVVLHDFSNSNRKRRSDAVILALKSLFYFPKSLRSVNPDIVYSANEMMFDVFPALRLKLKYRKKIKWVTVVHWLPPMPWKRKQSTIINSILFFINERISVWAANFFADVLLPVSRSTENQLKKVGANMDKVNFVECGVNYSEIRMIVKDVKEKKYDAVFMKRLQAVKGIFDLIDIWEIVVKSKPDAKILIIGEGIDGESAKSTTRDKGLEKNIIFTGVIYDLVLKFTKIAESRMFILPTYEENWAIVIGESMAAGVPVLSYDLKELVEVWGDNFVHIPLGNKEYFAKKTIDFLNSPEELNRITQKSLDFVKKYDWHTIAKKEMEIVLK